ncbi:hypothetical protein M433DRAFT_142321 [Acidomyces richmondensis BFW]|nr:hypothetical protein M433DRAFT_142321 [Acidomyces richmondensis BFW]
MPAPLPVIAGALRLRPPRQRSFCAAPVAVLATSWGSQAFSLPRAGKSLIKTGLTLHATVPTTIPLSHHHHHRYHHVPPSSDDDAWGSSRHRSTLRAVESSAAPACLPGPIS